jgi:hypothetical protein
MESQASESTVNRVVVALAMIATVGLIGTFVLIALDKDVPDGLIAIVAGATGSLGTLLASARSVNLAGLKALAGGDQGPSGGGPSGPT